MLKINPKVIAAVLLTIVFLWLLIALLNARQPVTEDTAAQTHTTVLTLTTKYGQPDALTAEIASTPSALEQGLMYRTSMDPDRGMLFVFETIEPRTFWMSNTSIPLDIIFLDAEMKVVKIHSNTKPNQTTEVYPSDAPVKFALETNAGWAQTVGLKLGDQFFRR